jgi:hypothetical protein
MAEDGSLAYLMRQAEDLIASASRALASAEAGATEVFLQHAASYLGDFEPWASQMNELEPLRPEADFSEEEKASAKEIIQKLFDIHSAVLAAAEGQKETVGAQMGAMHKKSKAIKTYLDPYPGRVSITGKRKG